MSGSLAISRAVIEPPFTITIEPGQVEMFLALRDIHSLRHGFTAADLARVSGATPAAAEFYLAKLARTGLAMHVGMTTSRQVVYAIAKLPSQPVVLNTKAQPDRFFRVQAAVWTAIRVRKSFTAELIHGDVCAAVNTTLKEVRGIIAHLEAATYLAPLYGETKRGQQEFKLRPAMNTGPLPPRLCEVSAAYDLNTRAFFGVALAREIANVTR